MACPKCKSPDGYVAGEICMHCGFIDAQVFRQRPPRRPPPPPPSRLVRAPSPSLSNLKRPLPPPPRSSSLERSAPSPRLAPPPPPKPPHLARISQRAAPQLAPVVHLSSSGSDWIEQNFPGTTAKVEVLMQPQLSSCGPSSVCMLVFYALGTKVSLGMMGSRVRRAENPDVQIEESIKFSDQGSDFGHLLTVAQTQYQSLNATQFDGSSSPSRLSERLSTECNLKKPALCHIAWDGGVGGHFTICLGADDTHLYFSDPYYGAVSMQLPRVATNNLMYSTALNSAGKASGSGTIRYVIFTNPVV